MHISQDIYIYIYGGAPCTCLLDAIKVLKNLQMDIEVRFDWFSKKYLEANADIFHWGRINFHLRMSQIYNTASKNVMHNQGVQIHGFNKRWVIVIALIK